MIRFLSYGFIFLRSLVMFTSIVRPCIKLSSFQISSAICCLDNTAFLYLRKNLSNSNSLLVRIISSSLINRFFCVIFSFKSSNSSMLSCVCSSVVTLLTFLDVLKSTAFTLAITSFVEKGLLI